MEEITVWYNEETDEVVEVKEIEGKQVKTSYNFDEYIEECSDDNYRSLLEALPLHVKMEKEMDYDLDELKDAYLTLYYRCKELGELVDAEYSEVVEEQDIPLDKEEEE